MTIKRVADILYERAVEDSANYAQDKMSSCILFFNNRRFMYSYAIEQLSIDGTIAEFGVFKGDSIKEIAKLVPDKTIYGFDSFYGLKEDWTGSEMPRGAFNVNGDIPKIDNSNVVFVSGYFDQSLPIWLKNNDDIFSFIYIDSDTYEAAHTVLENIGPSRIVKGTVILFDQYFGYNNWREHEFKAWQEFVKKYNINYEYKAINDTQVLVKIV